VFEDSSIRVVVVRRFVTLCKTAPYRNSLTYLLTYSRSPGWHHRGGCNLSDATVSLSRNDDSDKRTAMLRSWTINRWPSALF